MKLQSKFWKDRKINMPERAGVYFDSNGIADIEVDEKEARYLCTNITGLSFIETDEQLVADKVVVIDGNDKNVLENNAEIETNELALEENKASNEDEIAKREAIDTINGINKLKELKELAKEFNREEWVNFSTIEEFKTYLISKI